MCERRISEPELRGVRGDKMKAIRSCAKLSSEDAAEPFSAAPVHANAHSLIGEEVSSRPPKVFCSPVRGASPAKRVCPNSAYWLLVSSHRTAQFTHSSSTQVLLKLRKCTV